MKIRDILQEFVTPQAAAGDPGLEREKDVDVIFFGRPGQDWRAEDGWAALEEVLPAEYPPGSEKAQYKIAEVAKSGGAVVTTKPLSVAKKLVSTFNGYGIKSRIDQGLNEFAPSGGGGSGDYLKALASAWYNGVFDTGSLPKGIKTQEDVERLLNRGIVCPDGKTRRLHIDYNSDFDGVEIYSDDYYEHGDLDGNDGRTGQPWGPYDHMEFAGDELDEGLNEFAPGSGDDDDHQDPYGAPKPEHYDRSIDFFGQFEADHFDDEDMNDATGEFKGYWYYDGKPRQIAYFKFDNPRRTGSNHPGVGWYYEPQNEGVAEGKPSKGKLAAAAINKSIKDRKDPNRYSNREYYDTVDQKMKDERVKNDLNKFVRPAMNEQGVAEGSLNEFAPAGGGGNIPRGPKTPRRGPWDDGGEDPYQLRRYNRSADFFDQFDSDGVDKQKFDKATGEYEGYYFDRDAASGITQIAYFKFDDPTKIGDNDPGIGWYYEPIDEGFLNEFAPDSNDGGEDDVLHRYARMWWAGDEATQMQIERVLAKMGWEIGEDEGSYDNGGVFVVRAGDVNGNSYISWPAEELTEGAPVTTTPGSAEPGGAVDNFKQQMANRTEVDYQKQQAEVAEGDSKPEPPETDYGADYQDMVQRVKRLAGLGPLKTVYDPRKRVYRNVPTAVQPRK